MVHSRSTRRDALPPPLPPVVSQGEGACQCQTFLDPYPPGNGFSWRCVGSLQHYCRVCNTQLNSCKQSRIHVEGKKHAKRLAYLKFSVETTEAASSVFQQASQFLPGASVPIPSSQVNSMMPSGLPAVYAYPPPCATYQAPAYYYPAPTIPNFPNQNGGCYASYHEYSPPPPPPTTVTAPQQQRTALSRQTLPVTSAASHGVMSPSLTSGFSGSGDGKSTETCSLLSVASYNSAAPVYVTQSGESCESQNEQSCLPRPAAHCEVCRLSFPSRAVLEHHLIGSRHARKVKAATVMRQLQEKGAEFRALQPTGDIRCEICEVSVNSSHQLQAHMEGSRHKARCARQGLKASQATLTPVSSTAPSTTPSEASAPVRSHSVLVGRPKFGSRPNLFVSGGRSAGGLSHSGGRSIGGQSHSGSRSIGGQSHSGGRSIGGQSKPLQPARSKTAVQGSKLKTRKTIRQTRKSGRENQNDSTTESDDIPSPSNSTEGSNSMESEVKEAGEDTDEAKESEGDTEQSQLEKSEFSHKKEAALAKSDQSVSNKSEPGGQVTKASQTEPTRRHNNVNATTARSFAELGRRQPASGGHEVAGGRRSTSNLEAARRMGGSIRSLEGKAKEEGAGRRRSHSSGQILGFFCSFCQLSLNSKSQMSQHLASMKHRQRQAQVLAAPPLTHCAERAPPPLAPPPPAHCVSGHGGHCAGALPTHISLAAHAGYQLPTNLDTAHPYLTKGDRAVRDIPMLNMFLQRLQQHHYFPPIRDEEESGERETER